jgi:antitoxin ParD1/3/4
MATMNISLPDQMKEWVEQQVATGRYANASDYMRDLVRRDAERVEAIALLQREIELGRASGISPRSPDEIFAAARKQALDALKARDDAA